MALIVETKREFKLDKKTLPDPDPKMSVKEVIKFYSAQYPELTSCSVPMPECKEDTFIYTFSAKLETKG